MDENKNLNPEVETETVEEIKTDENVSVEKKEKKNLFKELKNKAKSKQKKLKNQNLLKNGSFSLVLTAIVIAGAIIVNLLVGFLADRFVLEFDMSSQKTNSISEENIEYIKGVEEKIDIIFCGDAKSYTEGYMDYYAQSYEVQDENAYVYYEQTVKLVERYGDYNKNINVKFVDTQSSEFTAIASEYSNSTINYGDIIVSCEKNGNKRFKIIGYEDIYSLVQDTQYASYGYNVYTVNGNKIETALTSAISYVISEDTKKIGIITGHSGYDYTEDFREVLTDNNYELVTIDNPLVTELSDELDAILIASPTIDFMSSELDVISAFLENDGNLSKGLIFFADATTPYLVNLYDFLSQWGIGIDEGVLFETNAQNHMTDDPLTMGLFSSGEDDISKDVNICITGYNIPMNVVNASDPNIEVKPIVSSSETVVAAPQGVSTSWTGHDDYQKKSYSGIIQAEKSGYDKDGNDLKSYVMAFGSIEYIYSDYTDYSSVSNKNISLAVAERAAGSYNTGIKFISKTITNESYADAVTESGTNLMYTIFMILIPVSLIIAGIVVFIKRRNS